MERLDRKEHRDHKAIPEQLDHKDLRVKPD
jgi:hypothetical protein